MTRITRRAALRQTGSVALLGSSAAGALAQGAGTWPNKPIRLIVNYGPGGGTDQATRPFAEGLSRELGQQVVIENRGGASGAIGVEAVIKSPPDGYTFLATPSLTVVILPHLRKLNFDPLKDLVPVTQFNEGTLLIAVHPSVPANTIPELVDYAKKNPGKLSWGTPGVGTFGHLICESFKHTTGTDILHVPYRGTGDAMADFLAGVFQIQADPITLPHVAAGKARLLAVLDRKRRPDYPNVPVLKEIYPDLDYQVWFGIFGPVGTPAPVVERMSQAFNKVAQNADIQKLMFGLALTPNPGTPDELKTLLNRDHALYGRLIKQFKITAE